MAKSITSTKNYGLFKISEDNRDLDLPKHRALEKSMVRYGFIRSFPIVCVRDDDKNLVVKDGQHRLTFAAKLGLPVYYVVEEQDFDIADANVAQKGWTAVNFVQRFAKKGIESYCEAIEFSEMYDIPIARAIAMLAGQSTISNVSRLLREGKFEIKDRAYAESVAVLYTTLLGMSKELRKCQLLTACMAVVRMDGFDPKRMISNAGRCRDKFASYSTRDAYLEMLEEIYNWNRAQKVPLKFLSIEAMKRRNAINKAVRRKQQRESDA